MGWWETKDRSSHRSLELRDPKPARWLGRACPQHTHRPVPAAPWLRRGAAGAEEFVRTGVIAPAFSYLRPIDDGNERMVDLTGIEPVTS
jgi:hypothetical protein